MAKQCCSDSTALPCHIQGLAHFLIVPTPCDCAARIGNKLSGGMEFSEGDRINLAFPGATFCPRERECGYEQAPRGKVENLL